MRARRLVLLALFVLAASALGAGLLLAGSKEDQAAGGSTPASDRRQAPELEGEVLVPPPVRLADLRGKPVVVNFWASWCVPCRDEAPILNDSAGAHRWDVVFVGVDVQDLRSDALGFLREFDVRYVSVRDRADEAFRAYGLTGVPETYYLDANGRIVAHSPGAISRTSLEAGIAQALEGRPSNP